MDKAANQKPETVTSQLLPSLAVDRTQTTCLTSGNNLVKAHMSNQSYDSSYHCSTDFHQYPPSLPNQSSLKESIFLESNEDNNGDTKSTIGSSQQKHGLIKKLLNRTHSNNTNNSTSSNSSPEKLKILELRSHRRPQQAIDASQKVMGNVHHGNPNYGAGVGGGVPHSPDENVTNKITKNATNIKSHNKQLVIHSHPTNQQTLSTSSSNDGHLSSCSKTNSQSINSSHTITTTPSNNTNIINGVVNNASNPTTTNETIVQLQEMVAHLKALVNAKDQRIQELERDKDKLRSVLHQQLTSSWDDSTLSSPVEGLKVIHEDLPSINETNVNNNINDDKRNDDESHSPSSSSSTPAGSPPVTDVTTPPPAAALLLRKRLGVSGESMKCAQELVYHDKDANSRRQIREALRSNDLIKNLDAVQLQEVVSCMHEQTVPANCYIIREGDDGGHLYVGEEGEFEVSKGGKRLYIMGAGRCFGELALLYNCKRTASVKAVTDARVWVLERACFQAIMMKTGLERIEERKAFLRSVPLLKDLSPNRILRIADALEAQYHSAGDCIIRQGELADSFFLIQSGKVRVTISSPQNGSNETKETEIRQLTKGEYFGEKALLGEGRRTANVYAVGPGGVEVLCLYRNQDELHTKLGLINQPLLPASLSLQPKIQCNILLKDLERICVLGVGGFGRVDLVTLTNDRTQAFALKRLQKAHIVQTRQQEHVYCEKLILSSVSSPFICRLFNTYRDNKYVYMLLEACLGGELWTILRDSHHLEERTTRFCLACCIEALDYLHRHGIVYRDLKPENMLVTSKGYIKLCDFGFAKYIGIGQKTWTFCGTPEYVAPEVILNQGHDFAADYWSLGILTFELLTGAPPFQASEPIKIYMKTLKGIDALGLAQNKYISLKALQFIRRLCRFNSSERLGVGKYGIQEIRSHKYFQGFDWAGIVKQTLTTPFRVKLNGPLDHSNFDRFTMDEQEAPDELSGWDANF
ncbi:serine/threonine kinase [Schistosoma mansoni]|uniref:serine/threonine kinase n=1 Tax=Schistosoma mansoni TaxID=6183 RepID=UPI0001A636B0|nr:serine/threonine kinase [Schistosoma mansoni]|eukprot:XP_018652973.1 serine/threonine kinase [Schistosoma mansoni]